MPKILRRLKINEVSSVDRGAGEGVHIVLMKQDDEEYWKREFSAEQRQSAADSGAALPDGSFPIHNKSDLHNAMRAIGRAKDPARAKAHIKRRAKALGLSGELTDAFKRSSWSEFFADLFGKEHEPEPSENFDQALSGLAESVKSIVDDPDADKDDMLAKSFAQFHDHVSPLLGDRALQQPTDKKEIPMSAILKALGLKEDASEEEALKAIAELAEKQRRSRDEDDEEEEDDEDEERKKQIENFGGKKKKPFKGKEEDEEKALSSLPESIRKQLADGADAVKRVKKLEDEAALVNFTKRAIEVGFPAGYGETLQKAYDGDAKAIDKLLEITKTGFAAAKEAGAFKEFGATGSGGGGTAFEQFTALAQAYMKAHPDEKLTESKAFTKVYEDPANKALRIQDANETGRGRTV